MRLLELSLCNFRNHEGSKTWGEDVLNHAMVGITGTNASGKSSLMMGIEWLLTGKLDGNQMMHVFGYGDIYDKASGSLRFEKDGRVCTIERVIGKGSKRKFTVDGEEFVKAADVDQKMSEVLGPDLASVARIVFVRQGDLTLFLYGTPTDRERLFTKLMDVGYLTKVGKTIEDKISNLEGHFDVDYDLVFQAHDEQYNNEKADLAQLEAKHRSVNYDYEKHNALISLQEASRHVNDLAKTLKVHKEDVRTVEEKIKRHKSAKDLEAARDEHQEKLHTLMKSLDQINNMHKVKQLLDSRKAKLVKVTEGIKPVDRERKSLEAELKATGKKALDLKSPKVKALFKLAKDKNPQTFSLVTWWSKMAEASYKLSKSESLSSELKKVVARKKRISASKNKKTDELQKEISKTKESLRDVKLLLDLCGSSTCPTCNQEVKDLPPKKELTTRQTKLSNELDKLLEETSDVIEKANLEWDQATQKEANIETALRAVDDAKALIQKNGLSKYIPEIEDRTLENVIHYIQTEDALEKVLSDLGKLDAAKKDLEEDIQKLEAVSEEAKDEGSKTQLESSILELKSEIQDINRDLESVTTSKETLKNKKEKVEETSASLDKHLKEAESYSEQFREDFVSRVINDPAVANRPLSFFEEAKSLKQGLKSNIELIKERLTKLETTRKKLEKERVENEECCKFIAKLKLLRDVFKKGGLPSLYIETVFTELCEVTRTYLNKMDSNFDIKRDPECTVGFLFQRNDQKSDMWQPQENLSGGQKVRLGLAFLIAVQQVLAQDLGLLVLDEPSLHLDDEGVDCLRELLTGMGDLLSGTSSQVVVGDHKEALIPAFKGHIKI